MNPRRLLGSLALWFPLSLGVTACSKESSCQDSSEGSSCAASGESCLSRDCCEGVAARVVRDSFDNVVSCTCQGGAQMPAAAKGCDDAPEVPAAPTGSSPMVSPTTTAGATPSCGGVACVSPRAELLDTCCTDDGRCGARAASGDPTAPCLESTRWTMACGSAACIDENPDEIAFGPPCCYQVDSFQSCGTELESGQCVGVLASECASAVPERPCCTAENVCGVVTDAFAGGGCSLAANQAYLDGSADVPEFSCDGSPIQAASCTGAAYDPPLSPACRACVAENCCAEWSELAGEAPVESLESAWSTLLTCTPPAEDPGACTTQAGAQLDGGAPPLFEAFVSCLRTSQAPPPLTSACYPLCTSN